MSSLPLRFVLSFLLGLFFTMTTNAQLTEIPGTSINTYQHEPVLKAQFNDFGVFRIDQKGFKSFIRKSGNNIAFDFKLGDQYDWTVSMTPNEIRSEDFVTKVQNKDGISTIERGEVITYMGYSPSGGNVRLTVDEQIIYGLYETAGTTYFIEPLWYFIPDAPKDLFIIYDEKDVVPVEGATCSAIETENFYESWVDEEEAEEAQRTLGCYIINARLAADWSMNVKYNGVAGATGHVIGVLNNVASNYDNEFNHDLLLVAGTAFVSNCSTCDPWTSSTSASALLSSFTGWGNSGGFGTQNYAVAGLWTNRNLAGSTIGIAWLSGLCNSSRYHVCQDFSSNAALLRVLQAHEIGHNCGATHDAGGAPFIMAPSVNTSNSWSTTSQNQINGLIQNRINAGGCLSSCGPPSLPPVAAFSSNHANPICPGDVVSFIDQSTNTPTSWNWSFPGGNPSSSTQQNPVVTYNTPGNFPVSLTVSNADGTNTLSIPAYVVVQNEPVALFQTDVNLDEVDFINNSLYGSSYLWDFGDGNTSTEVNPFHVYAQDGTYFVTLEVTNACGTEEYTTVVTIVTPPRAAFRAINNNGCAPLDVEFRNQSSTNITGVEWKFPGGIPSTSFNLNPIIEYPDKGNYDVTLIVYNSRYADTFSLPGVVTVKDVIDANFFTNTSIDSAFMFNTAMGWDSLKWDYGDGNTSDTIIENPVHVYDTDGTFEVKQITFNECGTDTLSRMVNITTFPVANFAVDDTTGCVDFIATFENLSSFNADTLFWSFPGGTPSTSTDEDPVVTYSTTGTFDVSLIVANDNGRDTLTLEDFIEVFDVPTSAFSTSINNFTEVSFNNSSAGATTYSWDFGDGNNSTDVNPVHVYATDGVYTVTLVTSNICGNTSSTQDVVIVTPPAADFIANGTDGCAPFTVEFTDQSSANTTGWSWTFSGGNPASSSTQNPTVTFDQAGTYDVSLTVSNAAGTDAVTRTGFITVGDTPNAAFAANVNLAEVAFTNNSGNANSFLWDFGDGNTSMDQNPVHTYSTDGVYTVTLTSTNGCGNDVVTQTLTIISLPAAGFTVNETVGCAPFTVAYANTSSSNATDFQWTFDGGSPSTSTDENPVVEYTSTGSYDVTLVVSNAAGADTISFTEYITVNTTPLTDFSTSVNQDLVEFTNNSTGGDSYFWDFGDGNSSTEENPDHVYDMDGTYTVTLTSENDCGTTSSDQTITIVTPTTASFAADATTGCEPFTVQFNNQSSVNSLNFQWSFPGGTPASSTDENPTVEYSSAGTYSVELIASNAGYADTVEFTNFIEVQPLPTADFSTAVDLGDVDFTNLSANADTYFWDFGDGNSSTVESPSYTYLNDGVYTVVLEASNDCGTTTFTQNIAIATSAPVALFDADATEGCAPFTVQFNNLSSANSDSYQWSFPGGNPSTSTDQNPVVVYDNPGTYDVTLTATNIVGDNTYTETAYIVVGTNPTAEFNFSVNAATASFSNLSSGGDTYFWDFGDGTTSDEENPGDHTFPGNGNYTVSLTVTNDCGTRNYSEVISIQGQIPVAGFDADVRTICAPGTVNFSDQSTGNPSAWNWTFTGGNPSTSTDQNPTIEYDTPGVYEVSLEVTNPFGTNTVTQTAYIEVVEEAVPSFAFAINSATVQFTNTSSGGTSFEWDFGDGTTDDTENPAHTYDAKGTYLVTLSVTNACGTVTTTAEVTIDINNIMELAFLEALNVYPNPNNGNFTIDLEGPSAEFVELTLMSNLGQLIYREKVGFQSGQIRHQVTTEDLSKGIYLLQVRSGNQAVYRKIQIQ